MQFRCYALRQRCDNGDVAQALASIAEMTGLTSLSLCDCSALTNNGMLVRHPCS